MLMSPPTSLETAAAPTSAKTSPLVRRTQKAASTKKLGGPTSQAAQLLEAAKTRRSQCRAEMKARRKKTSTISAQEKSTRTSFSAMFIAPKRESLTLAAAAASGNEKILIRLLSPPDNVALKPVLIDSRDNSGATALVWAVRNNKRGCAQLLIDAGANLRLADQDWNRTPVHWCTVLPNRLGMLAELLEAGADADSPDRCGRTPLINAVIANDLPKAAQLLHAGVKIDAVEHSKGWSALFYACDVMGDMTTNQSSRSNAQVAWSLLVTSGANLDGKHRSCGITVIAKLLI